MLVVFVLEIVMRNSVTRNTERVRITNAYWNDSCQTKQMKKMESRQQLRKTRSLFESLVFVYKMGGITIGEIHSVQ